MSLNKGSCGMGRNSEEMIRIPTAVALDDKVAVIECSTFQSLLISNRHQIYQFGSGSTKSVISSPTLIESLSLKHITACSAGYFHALCIDRKGVCWTWGRNDYGQRGYPLASEQSVDYICYFTARKIKAKECEASCNQSCVISQSGDLYVFGENDSYQLGFEDMKNWKIPTKHSLPKSVSVKKVSMGSEHAAFIAK